MDPIKVCIVDDSADIRMLLRVSLGFDERFEVVGEAVNGVEAIERAADLQPDLMLLDRQMPVLGGLEALPELRRVAPTMAIVVFSAYVDGGTRQAALAAGAADVKEKSGVDEAFIDELAALLVRAPSGTDDLAVRIGPVASSAARVWIRNTLGILRALRAHPDAVRSPVSDEVLATFTRFLHQWLATAAESETFHWAARADVATVQSLMEQWAVIDGLSDDEMAALGCTWSPPEGHPFFEALTAGVLEALEEHAATRDLAGKLDAQWRPYLEGHAGSS